MSGSKTTDFGFEQIPAAEKSARVGAVFDSVATRYDLMNDLMSLGAHRLWKRFVVGLMGIRPGFRVLDLAGGTGDLAFRYAGQVGADGRVVLADINASMLEQARDRMLDRGLLEGIDCVQADAECLPFADAGFDRISIAFGLRNVTDKPAALRSMQRVLKPGGRLLILEFSKVVVPFLQPLYDTYSFKVLPWLGRNVAKDEASYRYLAESIRTFPDQETLRDMMREAGFGRCEFYNLSGGIVAVHSAYRL